MGKQSTRKLLTFEQEIEQLQCKYDVTLGLPELSELPPGTVVGISAYTHEQSKRRWLDPNALVAPNVTASDAARCFLRSAYHLPLRRRRDQQTAAPVPLLVRRGRYPDAVYVDLKSTYKGIVEAFGFDVEYRRGAYLSVNAERTPLPDLVRENKRAYAAIVAMSSSYESVMQRWDGKKLVTFKVRNVFHQPCLWALTRDILLGVYSQMYWNFKLYYANTDGYIISRHDLEDALALIESWGFAASIKGTGNAEVYGVGSYQIGVRKTERVGESENFCTLPLGSFTLRWLKRRVAPHLAQVYGLSRTRLDSQ